ncbi:MAG: hypothetical protein PHQ55_05005 [Eubacteriales bacterium]|nr:hypothetical protein [Eubacteriales bacterium]MDD4682510.1 hypothetical protein [Eubacteriales bacterium]
MRQILRLTYIMLKGNGIASLGSDARKKRKFGSLGSLLLFLFLFVYLGAMMSGSSIGIYKMLEPLSLTTMIPGLYLSAAAIMTFVFGAVYVISIFYYSSDVTRFLPLPLKAGEIISAKLLVTAVYIEMVMAMLLLPSLTVYGVLSEASFQYYVLMVLSLILMPFIPLCLAAVIVILLMRLTPFARNKDRFNTVSGLVLMLGTFGFVFFIQNLSSKTDGDLAQIIENGAANVSSAAMSVFPGVRQAASLLTSSRLELLDLLLLILFVAVSWLIMLLTGRAFYFQGAVSMGVSGGRKRKISSGELAAAGKSGNIFWTLMLKDIRILLRTPIFLMNNVIMNFIWPIFLLVPFITGSEETIQLPALRLMAQQLNYSSNLPITIVMSIVFGFAAFVTGTNGIAASCLSREGRLLYFMKIIPVSYNKQILAKVSVSVMMAVFGCLIALIAGWIFFLPPIWLALPLLLVLPAAVILPALASVFFDLLWPKLHWDNEQRAVKQNMNVLYGMLVTMLLIAVTIVPSFLLSWFWPAALAALIIIPWTLIIALFFLLRLMATRQMIGIEA